MKKVEGKMRVIFFYNKPLSWKNLNLTSHSRTFYDFPLGCKAWFVKYNFTDVFWLISCPSFCCIWLLCNVQTFKPFNFYGIPGRCGSSTAYLGGVVVILHIWEVWYCIPGRCGSSTAYLEGVVVLLHILEVWYCIPGRRGSSTAYLGGVVRHTWEVW